MNAWTGYLLYTSKAKYQWHVRGTLGVKFGAMYGCWDEKYMYIHNEPSRKGKEKRYTENGVKPDLRGYIYYLFVPESKNAAKEIVRIAAQWRVARQGSETLGSQL